MSEEETYRLHNEVHIHRSLHRGLPAEPIEIEGTGMKIRIKYCVA